MKAFFSKASYRSYFNRLLVVQKFTFKNFKLSKHAAAKIFNFPVYVKFGIFFSNVNWSFHLEWIENGTVTSLSLKKI